jgi:hypothetical protein
MFSVTIPNITPSQNTPVLPNMRRSGDAAERRQLLAQELAKLSLATHLPSSGGQYAPARLCADEEFSSVHEIGCRLSACGATAWRESHRCGKIRRPGDKFLRQTARRLSYRLAALGSEAGEIMHIKCPLVAAALFAFLLGAPARATRFRRQDPPRPPT